MVFLIDLPKLSKGSKNKGVKTPFLEDLSYFLEAQGVDDAMLQSLNSYDFSETARYSFVHSMQVTPIRAFLSITSTFLLTLSRAGPHMDDSWKRTGYSGLGRAVEAMGWAFNQAIQVDYIVSANVNTRAERSRLALFGFISLTLFADCIDWFCFGRFASCPVLCLPR